MTRADVMCQSYAEKFHRPAAEFRLFLDSMIRRYGPRLQAALDRPIPDWLAPLLITSTVSGQMDRTVMALAMMLADTSNAYILHLHEDSAVLAQALSAAHIERSGRLN